MTPLKIHNGGSYALMEYLTCWKCVIFQAVTAWLLVQYCNARQFFKELSENPKKLTPLNPEAFDNEPYYCKIFPQ